MGLIFKKLGNNADQYAVYRESDGRTVAVTHDDDGGQMATMFAAAPELLASAKRLHAGVGNMLIQYPHLAEFMDDVLVSGLQDTLAAIAKAEKSENSA